LEKPVIALAMGDPAGISPELTAKVVALDDVRKAARVVVIGDKAFVPARDRGVYVFDMADPVEPVLEGVIATPGDALDVARGDGVIYVAQGDGGVQALVTGLLP